MVSYQRICIFLCKIAQLANGQYFQNHFSIAVNENFQGSPSRILRVLRISFGITTRLNRRALTIRLPSISVHPFIYFVKVP